MISENGFLKKCFLPFEEIAFENLEITEKCKSENKNTPISLDQEVPVADVWVWRQVSLWQRSELLWGFAVPQFQMCSELTGGAYQRQ